MIGVKVLAFSILAAFLGTDSMCLKPVKNDLHETRNVISILTAVDDSQSTKIEVVKK